jgi:hypothetical protein
MSNLRAPLAVTLIGFLCAIVAVIGTQNWAKPRADFATSISPFATAETPEPGSFRAGFRPLIERAAASADALVTMGDARERNLLRLHAGQDAMNVALADADTWLITHPPPAADVPAVAAYHRGAAAIRSAMDEAQSGFLQVDFARVARATETMREGAAQLARAVNLLH